MLTPYSRNTSINRSNNAQSNSVGLSPSSQQVLLRSDFTRYDIAADGDCLFRSVLMGLAERPGVAATREEVVGLRQQLADYISQNHQALSNDEVFRADNGLQNLYGLSLTTGAWADNAGDLVAPLLAQILGREINILQPIAGTADYQLRQALPPNNARFPAAEHPAGGSPLYLLQENLRHYSYLQRRDDIYHVADILLGMANQPMDFTNEPSVDRPNKKARVTPKTEWLGTESGCTPQPSLVPVSGQRFYFASVVDLSRAQTYTDLSGSQAQTRTAMPVGVIPIADIDTMSRRPIVQAPDDPNQAHPEIPQPAKINVKGRIRSAYRKNTPALKIALERLDALLQHPQQRQDYESRHFALAKIISDHLPQEAAFDHATLGMRGVIAKEALSAGSPLQYSAQYLSDSQWQEATDVLSENLQLDVGLLPQQAQQEAARLLLSYSWQGVPFNRQHYELSAFGAGNIAAIINHDQALANMGVAYVASCDKYDRPGPPIVLYFALRDIAKGEQLLVDYGQDYRFEQAFEGAAEGLATPEESLLSERPLSLVSTKEEADAAGDSPVLNPNGLSATRVIGPEGLLAQNFERYKKYQEPPLGYENFTDLKKDNVRSAARRFFQYHHLPVAPWAEAKRSYQSKKSKATQREQRQCLSESVGSPGNTPPPGFSKRTFQLFHKYQQPPEGYENFTDNRKDKIRATARHFFKNHHLSIPLWAVTKQDYIPKILKKTLPEKYKNPPEGYENFTRREKDNLLKRVRRFARDCNVPDPEWTKPEKPRIRRPQADNPLALEQPNDYLHVDKRRQSFFRSRAREAARIQQKEIPLWAQELQRESPLVKPQGYEDMSSTQRIRLRAYARHVAEKTNQPIPDWAQKKT